MGLPFQADIAKGRLLSRGSRLGMKCCSLRIHLQTVLAGLSVSMQCCRWEGARPAWAREWMLLLLQARLSVTARGLPATKVGSLERWTIAILGPH